ncbi:MAG TPA: CRTAC1 family protein [Thermoanaerobaculia bacterium]
MSDTPGFLARHAVRLTAIILIVALFGFARAPGASRAEREALAARFAFARSPLPTLAGVPQRAFRPVHPSLRGVAAWMSALGAAVALGDVDGDGLPNDVCLVDPRIDRALVEAAPGTGQRYPLFELDPAPLPYDRGTMAPMGCLIGDFNEDGAADLLVYYWGRTPVLFLRRGGTEGQPPAAALYRPVELVPSGERWYTNALTAADVDGDGHLDLIVGNYFPDGARLLDVHASGSEEMQRSMSRAQNGGSKHLLLWHAATSGPEPTAEFSDAANVFDSQTMHAWTLAIGAQDLDGDLLPEIYFANDFGNDRLLHNLSTPGHPRFVPLVGRRTFTTPSSKVLGRDSFKGMGIDFADLNGDGIPDIYVSNIAQAYALEENHFVWMSTGESWRMRDGVAPFVDRSEPLGLARSFWAWDARFADFDNDGVPEALQATGFVRGQVDRWPELQELALANDNLLHKVALWPAFLPGSDLSGRQVHDPFFVRAASGRYTDVADLVGMGDPQVSRGIAIADVDHDGRLDFAVANQWGTSYLFRNRAARPGSFLGLDLRLPAGSGVPGATRPAIGAAVTVTLPDGSRRSAQVDGGSGHSGKRAPELHFGLAGLARTTPLSVTVRWRDGTPEVAQRTFVLTPGWHRLILGREATAAPAQGVAP